MAEKLTQQQLEAVNNQGGKLLVSAAAGSGKTKVLVDRLLRYITDPVDPANVDDFLIITYTKAAAAELRGKIAAKLSERIAEQPENRHLQQQLQRLFLTKISTVHSFCTDVLREYAYLLDISDVNPLPAHYRCAVCKYTEFAEGDSGYDLPEKACPRCGAPMAGDGHDIPYETCMGPEGDMRVDIDINVPETIQQEAMEYLAQLLGSDRVAYAGTVSSFQNRLAEAYIRVYAHQTGEDFSGDKFDHMVQTLASVKRGEGRHPGGIVLLPEGMEWEDVTPVRMLDAPECSINKVTHMEFHSIEYVLPKLDLLGYRLLDRLQRLFAATGADPAEINYRDPKVYALFEAGDTCGVPEFSHPFCRGIMKKLEKISFSDLVKVSGMSHGTEVWLGNGACLLQDHPFRELIGDRDDIFRTLRCYGLDPKTAYGVMTATRKGSFGFE